MTPLTLYAIASILIVGNLIYNCGWGLVKVPESHRRPYLLTMLLVSLFPVPIVFPDFIASLISHGAGQLVPGSTMTRTPVCTQGFREIFKQTVFERRWLVAADSGRCVVSGCYSPPFRQR
jgi:hypothetical protein